MGARQFSLTQSPLGLDRPIFVEREKKRWGSKTVRILNDDKEIVCNVRVSSVNGFDEDYIEIAIEDNDANVEFLSLKLDYKTFGKLLGTSSTVQCPGVTNGLSKVGLRHEVKYEMISKDGIVTLDREKLKEALKERAKEYEIDGWKADSDMGVGSQQPPGKQRIIFRRWV